MVNGRLRCRLGAGSKWTQRPEAGSLFGPWGSSVDAGPLGLAPAAPEAKSCRRSAPTTCRGYLALGWEEASRPSIGMPGLESEVTARTSMEYF